jgi:hypothetical protein
MLGIYLTAFLSLTCIVQGKINEAFTLKIKENGLDFDQEISFDVENNLQILELPAHFNREATRYIKDLTHLIEMQVRWEARRCLIGKMVLPFASQPQIDALHQHGDNFHVEHENTTPHNFIVINGPILERSEIPARLRDHCPEGFTPQAIHTIDEKNIVSTDGSMILVKDPSIQDDVVNGSPPPNVTDTLHFLSRRKRQDACISVGLEDDCFEPEINCPGDGCPATKAFYNCKNCDSGSATCEYIFVCNTITSGRECIAHITFTGRKCHLCCGVMDCGDNMPKCGDHSEVEC